MAIKGSLKEASLPDVLQLLALGQKTGCLAIADRTNFGYIFFERGRICYASIVNRRDRLGDILVKNELITADQLEQAVAAQTQRRDRKLGEILVEQGAISRERLERYMRLQIEEAVYFLFTWTQGTFNFEADVRPERQDFLVSINPESLLLEGARRVDEWSLIEKKIPSLDLIFIVDRDRLAISDATLNEAQRLILPLIDGQRDVHQIIEDSGLSEFEVGKALYGLVTAGFLHRAGRSSIAARVAPVSDARIEEHRNLGIAFYKTGMLEEAAREFRRVVELRPGDAKALWACGMVAIRQARWREAMETLRLAAERGGSRPAVLANLGFAYEQLGRLGDADASYAEAAARGVDDARVQLGWGIVALKQGDVAAAATRLDKARQLAGGTVPAAWYWARALTAAAAGEFPAAESVAEEGVGAYPQSAVLRNNLAVLLELRGDLEAAEHQLTEARRDEPSLPQASKNLGDLAYRRGRYDDAWEHYRRAAQLLPDLGDDVYFKLGNIAFKRREPEQATELWQRALELNPHHELVRANLDSLGDRT
jgi:tetratricopeptide (TPR) repeat protein